MLSGKKIVICVTGSVAAIETPKLVRELRKLGADIHCVMTDSAQQIITKDVLEWASNNQVTTKITGKVQHVNLVGETPNKSDLMIIAPCTANTIGKIASGIDDTSVTTFATTAFGSNVPIIIVPSMHVSMYKHPIVIDNIRKLKKHKVKFIDPRIEENKAKFPDQNKIISSIILQLTKKDIKNKKILVTAGATIEEIDDVRYISNKSSGKMGITLANEAFIRGAEVTLVKANTTVNPKYPYKVIPANSAKDMLKAIRKNPKQDYIIHSAAVADFFIEKQDKKIKSNTTHKITLSPTVKILDKLRKISKRSRIIGFKAEYNLKKQELIDKAYDKLKRSNIDFIVANDIGKNKVFGTDFNEVYIINNKKETTHLDYSHKKRIANKILDTIK